MFVHAVQTKQLLQPAGKLDTVHLRGSNVDNVGLSETFMTKEVRTY